MKVGESRAARDEGSFSYKNAGICTEGGKRQGMIVSYKQPDPYSTTDLGNYPKVVKPLILLEAKASGSWYTNAIATYERYQGKGVARKLLAEAHKRWGFGLCFLYLRNVRAFGWNHKRVYRIYRELELNLRIKPRNRLKRDCPEPLSVPTAVNQVWSMDFMSDTLSNGKPFRTFNVLDDYNREGLGIEVDFSLPSERVIRSLNQIIEWRGRPASIRCDNGPEYISQRMMDWATENQINLMFIQPGKPSQNAYVERYNRTVRHEWLSMHDFESIEHAQQLATEWLWIYNNERPNSAVGGVPPRYLLDKAA